MRTLAGGHWFEPSTAHSLDVTSTTEVPANRHMALFRSLANKADGCQTRMSSHTGLAASAWLKLSQFVEGGGRRSARVCGNVP
jgi:hypothetical protein